MKLITQDDLHMVKELQKYLSYETYKILMKGDTSSSEKYQQAKKEFVRTRSQLFIVDTAEFLCGTHKGTLKGGIAWNIIDDKPSATTDDNKPKNFVFKDGFQVLSVGKWSRLSKTSTIEDAVPLLFRSTIQIIGKMPGNSPSETYDLKFITAGQNFVFEDTIDEEYEKEELEEKKQNTTKPKRILAVKTIECLDKLEIGYFSNDTKGNIKGLIKGNEYTFKITEYLVDTPTDEEKENIIWEFFYKDETDALVFVSSKNKSRDTFTINTNEYNIKNETIEIAAYFDHTQKRKEGYISLPYYLYKKIPKAGRIYFVGGAANDSDGWDYINRFKNIWNEIGFKDFRRIDASEGKIKDILFVEHFRESPFYWTNTNPPTIISVDDNEIFKKALHNIKSDLITNPLNEEQQLNFVGYCYGSVLLSLVALSLVSEGFIIDNLVLIGSPISDNSLLAKMLKTMLSERRIRNIIRKDISEDYLSNPEDYFEFIKGGFFSLTDDAPHFDLARPGKETDDRIKELGMKLRKNGLR